MSTIKIFKFILVAIIISLGYQNCGYLSAGINSADLVSRSCLEGPEALPVFVKSFHPFFLNNRCNECHTSSGVMFETPLGEIDPVKALVGFSKAGVSVVEAKLAAGHKGINLSEVETEFNSAKDTWFSEIGASCSSEDALPAQSFVIFEDGQDSALDTTQSQYLNKSFLNELIEWDLSEEPYNLPGLFFQMEVSVELGPVLDDPNRFKILGYKIQNLKMKTDGTTYRVGNIQILLNGQTYGIDNYIGIDTLVVSQAGDLGLYELIPGGSNATIIAKPLGEAYTNDDSWSVSIGILEAAN